MSALPLLHSGIVERREYRLWLWPHLLSLDAPVVALLWQSLLLRSAHQPLRVAPAAALAVAMWLIYVADRTFDVWRSAPMPDTARHRFYYLHRWRTAPALGTGALAALWIACAGLDAALLHRGALVAACVGAYLAAVHLAPHSLRRWVPKEFSVGAIFAAGTGVCAWQDVSRFSVPLIVFGLLCWANCAAIADWESGRADRLSVPLTLLCACAFAGLIAAGTRAGEARLFAAELLAALALLLLHRNRSALSADALRVLADSVLCTPLLFL